MCQFFLAAGVLVAAGCGDGVRMASPSTTVYFDNVYAAPGSLFTVLEHGIPAMKPERWAVFAKPGGGLGLTVVLAAATPQTTAAELTFTLTEDGGVVELNLDAITSDAAMVGDAEQVKRAWLGVIERRVVGPLGAHTVR